MSQGKKFRPLARLLNRASMGVFVVLFAVIGVALLLITRAAPGACSTTNVIGTSSQSITVPETAQYRLWVRMQVPDTTNTSNLNGVRIEFLGSTNQCFTVTANSGSANTWRWLNSDASVNNGSTAHVTAQMTAGTYTAKILGLKAGVKVDSVLLLKSDNTCVPDDIIASGRQPGDNCTTPLPVITFTANPSTILSGSSSTINWSATNATGCTGSGGSTGWAGGPKPAQGSFTTTSLTSNQTYQIDCTGFGGPAHASVTVTVTATPPPNDTQGPSVSMNIDGQTVTQGQQSIKITNQKSVTWRPVLSDVSGIQFAAYSINGQQAVLTNGAHTFGGQIFGNGDYDLGVDTLDGANNSTVVHLNVRLRHPDLNRNGSVDIFDLSAFLNRWQSTSQPGFDLNTNGVVDVFDLSTILGSWGSTQ